MGCSINNKEGNPLMGIVVVVILFVLLIFGIIQTSPKLFICALKITFLFPKCRTNLPE